MVGRLLLVFNKILRKRRTQASLHRKMGVNRVKGGSLNVACNLKLINV